MGANVPFPIRILDDLPPAGLVILSDVLSTGCERRLLPFGIQTWRRMVRNGQAPAMSRIAGRNAVHAEHIRAIICGTDWRKAKVTT